MFEKLVPYEAAYLILDAFINYQHQFKRITKRAGIRFENKDWHGIQEDARERLMLYRQSVGNTTEELIQLIGHKREDRDFWREMKEMFLEEILNFNSRNIAETFYNSVFRHSHIGLSADEDLMFVHATASYREFRSMLPIYHTIYLTDEVELTVRQLFSFFRFNAEFEDINRDIQYISRSIRKVWLDQKYSLRNARIEVLKSIFYRNKGAYIVGRIAIEDRKYPFVLPLLHEKNGIYVDALLTEVNDLSSIFSYNRSYFLVDTDIASEMVDFLKSILPSKSLGELYNSIGFEKHGKTVMFRDFLRHMQVSLDKFIIAPGVKGMVMSVFTLPSYNMVFKLIKDTFQPPKQVLEEEVKEKYALVSRHDRVGRMADSHMFENFVFEKKRFSKELLEELEMVAPNKLKVREDTVEIRHLYIEKKMVPLNLFLETATPEEAVEVVIEYGKAIKDMARVNIFPGDMLLKNFGVTRLNRVVFYDYDEIGFLTDYNFRKIPESSRYEDDLSSEPWYSVGPNDVFPEEFPKFLIGRPEILKIFYEYHGDLFDVSFWINVQKQLKAGEIVDVFPYRRRLRFKKIYQQFDPIKINPPK
jgi:isocitrate dehydrogenase kinase/phosphatase